jgi:hypothetical protein
MAAGSTYTPIATTTLGSSVASYEFTSISGSYTDLILVCNFASTTSGSTTKFQVNSDTGSNYSTTQLEGNGSAASSSRYSSQTSGRFVTGAAGTTLGETMATVHFQNYSNTTTYKTVIGRSGRASASPSFPNVDTTVNLWRSTSAITSLKIFLDTGNLLSGSTFTLYGIQAA